MVGVDVFVGVTCVDGGRAHSSEARESLARGDIGVENGGAFAEAEEL